jgi:hypothetical protein
MKATTQKAKRITSTGTGMSKRIRMLLGDGVW